jgi:hypothetical protein
MKYLFHAHSVLQHIINLLNGTECVKPLGDLSLGGQILLCRELDK